MDKFTIDGNRRLTGQVGISGSKNAALPIMAAVLASDGPLHLSGVPDLVDVLSLIHISEPTRPY